MFNKNTTQQPFFFLYGKMCGCTVYYAIDKPCRAYYTTLHCNNSIDPPPPIASPLLHPSLLSILPHMHAICPQYIQHSLCLCPLCAPLLPHPRTAYTQCVCPSVSAVCPSSQSLCAVPLLLKHITGLQHASQSVTPSPALPPLILILPLSILVAPSLLSHLPIVHHLIASSACT